MNTRFYPLLLVICGALVYANSLEGPFIYDDETFIEANEEIRRLWPPQWAFPPEGRHLPLHSRPLTSFTLALNYAVGELNVVGYHIVNIAIHLFCGLAFYGVVCRAGWTPGAAFFCALIWLLHPLNTESVDYVSQRSGMLMGLFYAVAFYCAQRGMASGAWGWYGVAVASALLSTLGKEAAATAPLAILLYDRTFAAGTLVGALRRRWGLYAGLAAVWSLVAYLLWARPHGGAIGFDLGVSAWGYLLNQCAVVCDYLALALWPHPLNIDYGIARALTLDDVWPQAALLVVLGATALWALWRGLTPGYAAAFFFLALAPTSSFLPIVTEVGAERRMYLPLMGVVVLVVAGGRYVLARLGWQRVAGPAGVGMVAILGAVTIARNADYRDPVALWAAAVAALPDNLRARAQLGDALADAARYDEAIARYDSVLQVAPNHGLVRISRARALAAQGRYAAAAADYRWFLDENPSLPDLRNSLGIVLELQGDLPGGIAEYRHALELRPGFRAARFNLGVALEAAGEPAAALEQYRALIAAAPEFLPGQRRAAQLLQELGDLATALDHYRQALALAPDDATLHNNAGTALAGLGNYPAAAAAFRRALDIDPDYAVARDNLAAALARQ